MESAIVLLAFLRSGGARVFALQQTLAKHFVSASFVSTGGAHTDSWTCDQSAWLFTSMTSSLVCWNFTEDGFIANLVSALVCACAEPDRCIPDD